MANSFKSGFVAIVGRPNVGKSTLLNSLMGEKLAIITNKPQTTRNIVRGIITTDAAQVIFVDTPGMHRPKDKLSENMVKMAENSVRDGDVILFMAAPAEKFDIHPGDVDILARLAQVKSTKFLVINKIDTIDKGRILPITEAYNRACPFDETFPISALKGENLLLLRTHIMKNLPEGPKYFPDGMMTDAPDAFIVGEMIREKALYMLQEEIPHGLNVEITGLKKRADKEIIDIEATIYCEKKSHKGIIIGKQGAMLKEIGTRARRDIQRLYDDKINLQLWVKIKENWRDSDYFMRNFGFKTD
ncbi:MAG: GTPase Era [Clostridiales bacterium]|jgi:GTP-binding protein Era|nr:GTPase Era [Clostridiales bacterium]